MWRGERIYFSMQHAVVAERAGRLALAEVQRIGEVGGGIDAAHALAAAARDGLDQHRIADRVGLGLRAASGDWSSPR